MVRKSLGCKRPLSSFSPMNRRALRGAALLYALAAVLIICTIILGTGRLVGEHFKLEETSQGYSRALYLAEAAAAWQLNRMSRCDQYGESGNPPAGRIAFNGINGNGINGINNINNHYYSDTTTGDALPAGDLDGPSDVHIPGSVEVWAQNIDQTSKWQPPQDFDLYAIGRDAATGIHRAIHFRGTGTGLAERYVLFAKNKLSFDNDPSDPISATGVCNLQSGYIGTNGLISLTSNSKAPTAQTPAEGGNFGGCRLGLNAKLPPGINTWAGDWDMPRLPNDVVWPTIADVLTYRYPGASLSTQNDNSAHILALNDHPGGVPSTFDPVSGDTSVLDDSSGGIFSQSNHQDSNGNPQPTIILQAEGGNAHNNVFYFKNIQMGPNDVLVLDLRPQTPPHGITIIVDNPNLTGNVNITNVAYWHSTDTNVHDPLPSFYWFNNTNMPMEFNPNPQTFNPLTPIFQNTAENWEYTMSSDGSHVAVEGILYGINGVVGDFAGQIIVDGSSANKIVVNCIVANQIQLKGRMQVIQNSLIEDPFIPDRYIVYYRISSGYTEPKTNDFSSPVEPQFDYGSF